VESGRVRSSGLLLVRRSGAPGTNLLAQVIIARCLTKAHHGPFTLATVVTGLAALSAFDSSGDGT
jgi:hypothetical protein